MSASFEAPAFSIVAMASFVTVLLLVVADLAAGFTADDLTTGFAVDAFVVDAFAPALLLERLFTVEDFSVEAFFMDCFAVVLSSADLLSVISKIAFGASVHNI